MLSGTCSLELVLRLIAAQSSVKAQLAMSCLTSSIHEAKGATACSCHDA